MENTENFKDHLIQMPLSLKIKNDVIGMLNQGEFDEIEKLVSEKLPKTDVTQLMKLAADWPQNLTID